MDLLTVKEAGEILKLTPPTMYRLIQSGELPATTRIGGSLRIRRAELEAALLRPAHNGPEKQP